MRPKRTYILLALLGVGLLLAAGCTTPTPPTTPTPTATSTAPLTTVPTTAPPTTVPITTSTMSMTMTTPPTTAPPTQTTAPTCTPSGSTTIDLVAHNIAFNTSLITVPAGSEVTVHFFNEDDAVPHNFAVYTNQQATDKIFSGTIIKGVSNISYQFQAPCTPGDYWFRCDVHPTIMYGTFKVT
jgi:plastocyanin